MSNNNDPVDAAVLAFVAYLEGDARRLALDHLTDEDRRLAEALMESLVAGRGIDPHASRPSLETLLAGTQVAELLPAMNSAIVDAADPTTAQQVLRDADRRAHVDIDFGSPDRATVVYSYLDFRARFLLVQATEPTVTEEVVDLVRALFDYDPDTVRVGVVAARNRELETRVLSADEVGHTITTPHGEPHTRLEPPLPLALAARRILEQNAPEWGSFGFDQSSDPIDVTSVATEAAERAIEREAARPYKAEKARAYRALVGRQSLFAALAARVFAPGTDSLDLNVETERITQAAA
jgi:hypothetical protein